MTSTPSLPIQQKQAASDFIHERFGLFFPPERFADMLRALCKATEESGFDSMDRYVSWLLSNQLSDKQLEPLITNLTIGETYFFRDKKLFSGLEKKVFPEIVKTNSTHNVRIWSAACSTGEEPYSLAILLDQAQNFPLDWHVNLYATDVNVKSLAKARKAEYSQWSFRGIDERLKSSYFSPVDKHHWKLLDRMRQRIEFSYLNLAVHPLTVGSNGTQLFDLILCRNVLMYFSAERRGEILHHLTGMLTDSGWLVVSPSEVGLVDVPALSIVDVDGMLMHRKGVKGKTAASAVPWRKDVPQLERVMSAPVTQKKYKVKSSDGERRIIRRSIPPTPPQTITPVVGGLAAAVTLVENREYQSAIACLMCLIADEVASGVATAEPIFVLARCLANIGRADEAEEWLEKALELDRLNATGYYLLATVQQERGSLVPAKRSLEQALYLDGDFIMATFALGMLLVLHGGQKEQGEKMLRRAKALLMRFGQDEIVPDSEGLTVAHLCKMLESMT
ncbi:MAG: hypothetical protein BA874_11960 [Desulfuromonadales bacterium C00003068]|jgi:chemotaxis protein methyltransferase CheR|nr:MAG: hypothetical protein BA874_11960 [Desulfuromonadales bacterium C00003068]